MTTSAMDQLRISSLMSWLFVSYGYLRLSRSAYLDINPFFFGQSLELIHEDAFCHDGWEKPDV